jgi:hypothetical protein
MLLRDGHLWRKPVLRIFLSTSWHWRDGFAVTPFSLRTRV